ncbi:MAG: inositol monophosphatase family protein, partial [Gammaproteobacteria bacterium]
MHPMLNIAVRAARRAGTIISRSMPRIDTVRVEQKGRRDYVTSVDRAAEAAIIETLLKAYPDHQI